MKSKFSGGRIKTDGITYPNHRMLFHQLTPDQKNIIETKQINGSHTTSEWLELFENLETHDMAASIEHAGFGFKVLVLTIPLTVLNFLIFMALLEVGSGWATFIALVMFVGLIFTWVMAYQHSAKLHKNLLPDYFRSVLLPLVAALHEETEESTPVYIAMDLRHQMNKKAHLIDEDMYKCVYDWHILQLSTELHQGIRMNLSIRIHNHLRLRKSKSKRRVFINLTMEYSKKKHQLIHPVLVDQQRFKVKHAEKPKKHVLRLRRQLKFKDKFFNFYQYTDIPFAELVFMIRSGYQVALREQQA